MLTSFRTNETKLLTVSYSVEKWQQKIDFLNVVKNAFVSSDLPSREVKRLNDSITSMQNEMIAQLQIQIRPDSTKKK